MPLGYMKHIHTYFFADRSRDKHRLLLSRNRHFSFIPWRESYSWPISSYLRARESKSVHMSIVETRKEVHDGCRRIEPSIAALRNPVGSPDCVRVHAAKMGHLFFDKKKPLRASVLTR